MVNLLTITLILCYYKQKFIRWILLMKKPYIKADFYVLSLNSDVMAKSDSFAAFDNVLEDPFL